MKQIIFPIGFILMTLASCKCDEQKVVYSVGDDMYAYVFNDSSFWVYKNTTTSNFDTVIVYRTEHGYLGMDTDSKCITLQKEFFDMKYLSTNKPFSGNDAFFIDYEGVRLNGTGNFPYKGLQIYNRLAVVGDSTIYTKYSAFYPTLTIEGQVYSNVKKIWVHYDATNMNDTFYYWAPHVGIVKREFHSNGTIEQWNLIEKSLK